MAGEWWGRGAREVVHRLLHVAVVSLVLLLDAREVLLMLVLHLEALPLELRLVDARPLTKVPDLRVCAVTTLP